MDDFNIEEFAEWAFTSVTIMIAVKLTGSPSCLWAFLFPVLTSILKN